jgi:hypothetical protein
MKTGNAGPVKHTGGGGSGPVGGGGPISGAGGGRRSQAILQRIAKQLGQLSKAFDDLANTPIGGVPSGKGTAKKK